MVVERLRFIISFTQICIDALVIDMLVLFTLIAESSVT